MGGTVKMERFELDEGARDQAPKSESGRRESWSRPEAGPRAEGRAPADPDALRTRLAKKFTTLADHVSDGFDGFRIGAGSWGVELMAPEGMSTRGGKERLQHLKLRPRRAGFSTFVGGSVDAESKYAELRTYDYVRLQHEMRFAKAMEITEQEWEQFLRKAELELRAQDIEAVRIGPPKDLVKDYAENRTPISRPMIFAFVGVVLLAAFMVWRVILALAH